MKSHFIHIKIIILLLVSAMGQNIYAYYRVSPDMPLALRFCRSEMLQHPDYKTIDRNTSLKWNYTHGLLCQSILDAYDYYHSDTLDCSDLQDYVFGYYKATITEEGTIYKYKKSNYNIDHVNPGKCLFRVYRSTGDKRFLIAMNTLRDQLTDHPRTSDGGFWHKNNYPWQMWLDGLYMGTPYYAEYAKTFEDDPTASYADVVKQFLLAAEHTRDERSGLYRHGWDEKCVQIWADPITGQSSHVWGRALGWYTMALVDVIEILPDETAGRDSLISILQGICNILPQYQDAETGCWYQVIDYPDSAGNYQEMSCTAMFARSIAKGVRLGYLDKNLLPVAQKAFHGMLDNYFEIDDEGLLTLKEVCSVAGLSNDRDGSYNYYVNETSTVDNDPKGVGPFIMLCIEMDRIGDPGIEPEVDTDDTENVPIVMPDGSIGYSVIWYMSTTDSTTATIAPTEISADMTTANLRAENSTGTLYYTCDDWIDEGKENSQNYIQYRLTPDTGYTLAVDSITFKALRTKTDKMHFSAIYSTDSAVAEATYLCSHILPARDEYEDFTFSFTEPIVTNTDFVMRFLPYPSSGLGSSKYAISYRDVTFHCRIAQDSTSTEIVPPDTIISHTYHIDEAGFSAILVGSQPQATIEYTVPHKGAVYIQLTDIGGHTIYKHRIDALLTGRYTIPMDLPRGLYFIVIGYDNDHITLKYHKK